MAPFESQFAVETGDDGLHDGQAQAAATARLTPLETPRLGNGAGCSFVQYVKDRRLCRSRDVQAYRIGGARVFARIVDQVAQGRGSEFARHVERCVGTPDMGVN